MNIVIYNLTISKIDGGDIVVKLFNNRFTYDTTLDDFDNNINDHIRYYFENFYDREFIITELNKINSTMFPLDMTLDDLVNHESVAVTLEIGFPYVKNIEYSTGRRVNMMKLKYSGKPYAEIREEYSAGTFYSYSIKYNALSRIDCFGLFDINGWDEYNGYFIHADDFKFPEVRYKVGDKVKFYDVVRAYEINEGKITFVYPVTETMPTRLYLVWCDLGNGNYDDIEIHHNHIIEMIKD